MLQNDVAWGRELAGILTFSSEQTTVTDKDQFMRQCDNESKLVVNSTNNAPARLLS